MTKLTEKQLAERLSDLPARGPKQGGAGNVIVTAEVALWGAPGDPTVDQNRPLRAQRACPCGCDNRGRDVPVIGYVTGSKGGQGLTIFAPDEATYQVMAAVFGEAS